MDKITLYSNPKSRGMRVQQVLDIFNIEYESVFIDFEKEDHKKADYKIIHPHSRVPALRHGDTTIIESGAIILYLADLFPDKLKAPAPGTPERARLYEWTFFLYSSMELALAPLSSGDGDKEAAMKKAHLTVTDLLAGMASKFVGPYVLGEEMTVLDVVVFCDLSWLRSFGMLPEGIEPFESFLAKNQDKLGWDMAVPS